MSNQILNKLREDTATCNNAKDAVRWRVTIFFIAEDVADGKLVCNARWLTVVFERNTVLNQSVKVLSLAHFLNVQMKHKDMFHLIKQWPTSKPV